MKKANGKIGAAHSSEPSRARGKTPSARGKTPSARGKTPSARGGFAARDLPPLPPELPAVKRKPGRPRGTPDVWTPEYINEVVTLMEQYTEESDYPTVAEFCYSYAIAPQRLAEHPETRAAKEMLFAKRQAVTIRRGLALGVGEGALGSFLLKLSANAGTFSLAEKQAVELSGGVRIVDDV